MTISHKVAAGTGDARDYESIQREHGENTIDAVIHAMSVIIETRDPYTAGHQQRVADLACAIAGEMKLSEWYRKGIRISGLVHDIGKLVVPAGILTKPGKLDQSEFNIIKTHPRTGYNILEMIEFPWPVNQSILQHHERLDGTGYPGGISGEDIILDAKILAVADVVEAISSRRSYHPALGLDCALEEISRGKGVLYDPRVVDACLRLFKKRSKTEFEQIPAPAASA